AVPANIQTLVDLAKTHCLDEEWEKAEKLFKQEIFYIDGAVWNVDVNFYHSWAVAGKLRRKKFSFNGSFIKKDRNNASVNRKESQDDISLKYFQKSFQCLDYALYQRPRFIVSWEQTNWKEQFGRIADILETKRKGGIKSSNNNLIENAALDNS